MATCAQSASGVSNGFEPCLSFSSCEIHTLVCINPTPIHHMHVTTNFSYTLVRSEIIAISYVLMQPLNYTTNNDRIQAVS